MVDLEQAAERFSIDRQGDKLQVYAERPHTDTVTSWTTSPTFSLIAAPEPPAAPPQIPLSPF